MGVRVGIEDTYSRDDEDEQQSMNVTSPLIRDEDDDSYHERELDDVVGGTHEEHVAIKKDAIRRRFHHPVALLCFLSFVSLLNYYDRGAFAGTLPFIKEEFGLSNDEAGLLGSAFIAGYAVVSPFMAQLSRYVPSGLLLMVGMTSWCLVTGLCFMATGFNFLMAMRCLTGIGEAAFICLSPALIDDAAPPAQRSRWLAIFFSMLPIGYALGYMGSGLIGHYMEWQWVFLIEALVALPFALMCYYLPDVRHPSAEEDGEQVVVRPFHITLLELGKNYIFMFMTFGYCAQTFVLGALTLWLPDYVYVKYGLGVAKANFLIGAITAACGILGNLFSSYIMDFLVTKKRTDPTHVGINMSVLFVAMAIPLPFIAVFMDSLVAFLFLMLGAEFFILCSVTPVNSVFLSCVPEDLRGHAMAIMTMLIHVLGDLWSPYFFGMISDNVYEKTGDEVYGKECAMLFLAAWGVLTLICWLVAWAIIRRRALRSIRLEVE